MHPCSPFPIAASPFPIAACRIADKSRQTLLVSGAQSICQVGRGGGGVEGRREGGRGRGEG